MCISGIKLKRLREQKGMGPADVAKFLGITRPAYLKYEKGTTQIPRQIKKLANYFGVTTDYLLDNDITQQEVFSEDETKLVYSYRQLNSERKKLIKNVIFQFNDGVKKADNSDARPNIIQNNHHNNGGTNILNVGGLVKN